MLLLAKAKKGSKREEAPMRVVGELEDECLN
jgi:hypothetical protein